MKNNIEAENARLKEELCKIKKEKKSLSGKLERSKRKITDLQKEVKKNDVRQITLSNEQEQLLSNLLPDINILNLLSD